MKQTRKKPSKKSPKRPVAKGSGKRSTQKTAKPRAKPISILFWILGGMAGGPLSDLGNKVLHDYLLPALQIGLLGFSTTNKTMDALTARQRRRAVRVPYALDILLVELSKREARAVLKEASESFAIVVPHLVRIIRHTPTGELEQELKAAVQRWILEVHVARARNHSKPVNRM